ncbi:MAG: hypothetical protein NC341_09065 [Blautia sp.]|nr:hypothetical protein [Blautia sp.]MCM1201860.1 hypothetical protein [Bacteroides fragilis]
MGMNVNGIGKQPCYEKTNGVGKQYKNTGGSFSKSLSENLNERAENGQIKGEAAVSASPVLNAPYSCRNVVPAAVTSCEVRHLPCFAGDYVKAFAAQGFSLTAQVDVDGRSVYIEQRLENGTVKGYEVDIDKLSADTTDPVGQTALEAWEKKEAGEEKESADLTVEEALERFYAFIEDRIRNGPPKYIIGNSEFSVEEWNKLLEDFDDQLDAVREEMRERIAKLREQQLQAELSAERQSRHEEVQEAEEEETEEKLLTALFQNKGRSFFQGS